MQVACDRFGSRRKMIHRPREYLEGSASLETIKHSAMLDVARTTAGAEPGRSGSPRHVQRHVFVSCSTGLEDIGQTCRQVRRRRSPRRFSQSLCVSSSKPSIPISASAGYANASAKTAAAVLDLAKPCHCLGRCRAALAVHVRAFNARPIGPADL